MASNLAARRGPRHTISSFPVGDPSEVLQAFKRWTHGLTGRLRVPSFQSMRAGAVKCPHLLVHQFLVAGHRAGLPQSWAEQFVVWLRCEVDRIWAAVVLPLPQARRLALEAESGENTAEQEALLASDALAQLIAERDQSVREIAADLQKVASLNGKIRYLKSLPGPVA